MDAGSLLSRDCGQVSSSRDPQRDAIAYESTLSRNSCDCRMSIPRNPAPSICCANNQRAFLYDQTSMGSKDTDSDVGSDTHRWTLALFSACGVCLVKLPRLIDGPPAFPAAVTDSVSAAGNGPSFFQLYSFPESREEGSVDMSGCNTIAWTATTDAIVCPTPPQLSQV